MRRISASPFINRPRRWRRQVFVLILQRFIGQEFGLSHNIRTTTRVGGGRGHRVAQFEVLVGTRSRGTQKERREI